ncbi:low molecular weight phosphotyrosine protein phosphatase-like isoform X2 [Gordionus sp. m RMFG-2023]|uniref:low molecular weight phosphotyrosine protein phosphatase-like isoform X2 n=1 Tax=Gordionus sp. m RMFG-2023 TaxID=3053472 RepID=UPI0031FD8048
MTEPKSVLMVCLGNICRSPIAEACLRKILEESYITNWKVDSAGTGDYHLGKSPDHRAMAILKNHDINFSHKARQLVQEDFYNFDYILCMDQSNIENVKALRPLKSKAKIELLGKWDYKFPNKNVRDPYYDKDQESFEDVYQQCIYYCTNFFKDTFCYGFYYSGSLDVTMWK